MKTIFLILSLIIISNLVFGQIPKNAIAFEDKEFNNYFLKKENIPVVKGKILNVTNDEIKQIKIKYAIVTPFASLQRETNCELNTDGTFEIKLDYAFPYQQIFVFVGDLFFAGLYANKELYVELDAHLLKLLKYGTLNTSGVRYLGKDGALNTYMNNHVLYAKEKRLELYKAIELLRNKTTHIKKYDSLYAVLTELDNEYIKQNPSDFSWLVINERQSQYYKNLCSDNFSKKMPIALFEKVKKHKAYLTSNDGMVFYQYLFMYLQVQGNVIVEPVKHIKTLDSLLTPSKADFLKLRFSGKPPNEQKKILEAVLPTIKTDWCKTVLQNEYNNTIKKLQDIKPLQRKLNNPDPSPEAIALYRYLLDIYGKKTLSGQMCVPWGYGELKYLQEKTGKQPAIRGIDFIHQRDNDDEVQHAIDWWRSGGIPTIMWTWGAPGIGEGYENSKERIDIDRCFVEGTEENKAFWSELKIKADLLEQLKDAHVPILWRPYLELNGNWFWYGKQGPERFKKLWITMYDYFIHERKLNNLIWVLCYTNSPDASWFPGDAYVDIAGADSYDGMPSPHKAMYTTVKEIVKNNPMPLCYHECDQPPVPDDCFNEDAMWLWWMEWHTNFLDKVNVEYLNTLYHHELIITKDELPDIMKVYGKE